MVVLVRSIDERVPHYFFRLTSALFVLLQHVRTQHNILDTIQCSKIRKIFYLPPPPSSSYHRKTQATSVGIIATMQEEDWGKYSQAPWMTGETWQDTNTSKRSKERKARKSAQVLTNEHACDFSSEDKSSQEEDRFRTEVDLADFKISYGAGISPVAGDPHPLAW